MQWFDILILIVIGAAFAGVVAYLIYRKVKGKKSGCCGCGSQCPACCGCRLSEGKQEKESPENVARSEKAEQQDEKC